MDIQDLFQSPSDHIAKFAELQVHLYRNDAALQDYFLPLHIDQLSGPDGSDGKQGRFNSLAATAIRAADMASQFQKRRKIKTDVLFAPTPYFGRKTEHKFLIKTLIGLAQTGAEVLCLLPMHAPILHELESELSSNGVRKQIQFLDPSIPLNPIEARTRPAAAKLRALAAFDKSVQILEPLGLNPRRRAFGDFERTARFVEAWERIASSIEFDAVVARCHWYDLCSPVCRTGMQRGRRVITFQQGVIGHTLDLPITASHLVTFGRPSADVMAQANQRFFGAIGSPEPEVKYLQAGSLFDDLSPLPDQFANKTVLIVDMHSVPRDFCGVTGQEQALIQLAEKLLQSKIPMRRLIFRPHPHWSNLDIEACLQLSREYRDVCEVSHSAWPLEDDLRRSSVVLGIWSGVLTVASACGLPSFFLQTENGFATQDLSCFSPDQTLRPDEAFCQISKLLLDPDAYREARKVAIRNGSEYYANGANASLDGPFFNRLLTAPQMNRNTESELR